MGYSSVFVHAPSPPPPHTHYVLQWPSTSQSVFEEKTAATVVVDLMYKVHTTHPDILMLCCQLLNQLPTSQVRVQCCLTSFECVFIYPVTQDHDLAWTHLL